ncbi:glycosyl hydrolase [Bacillus solimangrovi]|uniref:glucan endo-1,3-beta-D-glucosidase n=1 Tax=Bacillus solimangrovi TaxID=1305675 RepID=A0A1E5LHJ9_9BACI|nr:glycosyl hydrolase [Bacillus solimangrovi]OEH93564.1 glycoside hydrolase family 81 [Bacillus solimangrovi]
MNKLLTIVSATVLSSSLLSPSVKAFSGEVELGAGSYSTVKPVGVSDVQDTIYKTPNITGAMPTNDWWSSTAWEQYSNAQYPHPLAMINEPSGLRIYNPSNNIEGLGGFTKGWMNDIDDFVLGHTGTSSFENTKVDEFSDWFVTNEYKNGESSLHVTYGHGSPFVYAEYEGGEPRITLPSIPPTVWYGDENSNVLGITTEKGSHYALFGPTGSTWSGMDTKTLTNHLNGKNYFSVAVLPDNSIETLKKFEQYAYSHVVDTKVDWSYNEATSEVETTFMFETEAKEGSNEGTIFTLYPHQWKNTSQPLLDYTFDSVRGTMKVAEGNSFKTTLIFNGVLPSLPDLGTYDKSVLTNYINEAQTEVDTSNDTYYFGKRLGELATLAPIAEQVDDNDAANQFRQEMKNGLEDWLTASDASGNLNGERLFYYNDNWGTLLGYPDSFGSVQEMNDHHFHYGYFIKAAAEIARVDKEWASNDQWGQMVELLIKDIANMERNDEVFPFLRNFDMYAGHTWASGHAKFFDGNNNESSSEAMNAWAGIILWGEATDNKELRDLGIYLFTTEMNAINEYWFDVTGENHNPDFTRETASMLWGGKTVGDAVWWTNNPEEVHGINWLPITGASLYLTQYPEYTKRNYEALVSENGGDSWDAWEDLVWMYRAIENPEDAIRQFNERKNVFVPEGGNTKANTYHWIHNLNALGNVDPTITADYPIYAVFTKNNAKTYVVYNMTNSEKTVTFSDGTIVTVQPHQFNIGNDDTDSGEQPDNDTIINAFERIEAELYTSMNGIETEQTSDVDGDLNISSIDNGDYLVYENVDFGSGATGIEARFASESTGGTVDLRLDNESGELIGTIDFTNTDGLDNWITSTATISNTTGIHDLYLVFNSEAETGLGILNWFTFTNEPIDDDSDTDNDTVIVEDDFSIEMVKNEPSSVTFIFSPTSGSSTFVDFHYTVNENPQQNVKASENNGKWEYVVTDLQAGDSIQFFYTYAKEELAYDSPSYEYTH